MNKEISININSANIDFSEIELVDLVMAELYDLSELFGIELKLDRDWINYRLKMALLGELISVIREKDIEVNDEIIGFLNDHSSSEELYQKIDFLLLEFIYLHPELLRSISYSIPELLELREINIADELIIQRILELSQRLKLVYNKLNII